MYWLQDLKNIGLTVWRSVVFWRFKEGLSVSSQHVISCWRFRTVTHSLRVQDYQFIKMQCRSFQRYYQYFRDEGNWQRNGKKISRYRHVVILHNVQNNWAVTHVTSIWEAAGSNPRWDTECSEFLLLFYSRGVKSFWLYTQSLLWAFGGPHG